MSKANKAVAFLAQVGKSPASAAASKAVMERWGEIWNQGKLALVDETVAADCVMHSSRGDRRGREAVRESYGNWRAAFPDMHFTVIHLVVEGDMVLSHWTFRGTHRGEWAGVAATGKPVVFDGANAFRIADCRISEIWSCWDMGAFLRQVGKPIS